MNRSLLALFLISSNVFAGGIVCGNFCKSCLTAEEEARCEASCAPNRQPEYSCKTDLPKKGRMGLHGMVVFGSGPYFFDHIPMLMPPHDFQVTTEVELRVNGKPLNADFSKDGFTFKPHGMFSLNDYVVGRLKKFSGAIYHGSFEGDGTVVPGLENVEAEVIFHRMAHALPWNGDAETLRVQDTANNLFEINAITPTQNFQSIRNSSTGKTLWCVVGPDFIDSCD